MIQFVKKLTIKQRILLAFFLLPLFVFLLLFLFSRHLKNSQQAQQMAGRWDPDNQTAQISCFFPEGMVTGNTQFLSLKKKAEQALSDLSIIPSKEGAKLITDAYSAAGEITLSYKRNTLTAKAIGVSGDFFLFHPLSLVNGSFFTEENPAKDAVVIDEEAAWQLFGSNDVIGMKVMIGNTPHSVAGVIKREGGRLNRAAGLDKTVVYVSYESLQKFGTTKGLNTYEIVMPNPIPGFAYSQVTENLGFQEHEIENQIKIVENSKRFSFLSLLQVIRDFGIRSMNSKNIIYPYWENAARGIEDILSLLLLLEFLLLLTAATALLLLLHPLFWTIKKKAPKFWPSVKALLITGCSKCRQLPKKPGRLRRKSKNQLH